MIGLYLSARVFQLMLKLTNRVAVVLIVVGLSVITTTGSGRCDGIPTGGLDELAPGFSLGPNLLVNGDLRSGLQGWTLNPGCFSLDGTGDSSSMKLQEPCVEPYPTAKNDLKCPPGQYTISAEIKTQTNITIPKRLGGTRIVLLAGPARKWAMTKAIVGTNDWTPAVKAHCEVAEGSIGSFIAGMVGPAAGTSWFRKFSLRRELPAPLETYLLYPNYRGMMFSDASQVARLAINVHPPADASMAQFHVGVVVSDQAGKVILTKPISPPVDGSTIGTVDMGGLPPGHYRLQGHLLGAGDKEIFTPPAYTIVKV